MEYVYYCTRCGHVGTLEIQNPYNQVTCSQCNEPLSYTGCSKEVWDQKTKAEQDEIINHLISAHTPSLIKKISSDLRTIKNILIFFTAIWAIGIIILLVTSCSLRAIANMY